MSMTGGAFNKDYCRIFREESLLLPHGYVFVARSACTSCYIIGSNKNVSPRLLRSPSVI
jgi:hypothetical protein